MTTDVGQTLLASLNNALVVVAAFIPRFVAGLVIILIGIVLASILRQVVVQLSKTLKIEEFLRKYGVPEAKQELSWTNILAEIVRWFVIILFLIPTADVWGLTQIVTILNSFILYLPNVFVAAVILLVGLVLARITHDVVLASTRGIDSTASQSIATIARWAITVFVFLAALSQLGVATDLIRILFTGFVAMLAIAGGIAFGLGGQDAAKETLEVLRKGFSRRR